jgi:hypothetical protein
VINRGAYDKFAATVSEAKDGNGTIVAGGEQLTGESPGPFVR